MAGGPSDLHCVASSGGCPAVAVQRRRRRTRGRGGQGGGRGRRRRQRRAQRGQAEALRARRRPRPRASRPPPPPPGPPPPPEAAGKVRSADWLPPLGARGPGFSNPRRGRARRAESGGRRTAGRAGQAVVPSAGVKEPGARPLRSPPAPAPRAARGRRPAPQPRRAPAR